MEGHRTKAAQSGRAIKPATRVRYEKGKSGDWKIWHVGIHARTKGGGNKYRRYTSTYSPGEDRNTTAGR